MHGYNLGIGVIVLLCQTAMLWAQGYHGYRLEADRIVVEGDDWQVWDHPKGVLKVDEVDGLRPRFVRKNINTCLNADEFEHNGIRGGVKDAGSSRDDAANVMDGNMRTFWEPSKEDSLKDWWFEIDLGRLVPVIRIVLKFVEEGKGDPFLQFKVEVSNGWRGWNRRDPLRYRKIGETTEPNDAQRVFEFGELSLPFRSDWVDFSGDDVQYVRIRVIDTRGDKREEVSKEKYEALAPDWRGRVEYFRIMASGKEWLVPEDEYRKLPPEEKGAVKYYRREVPRLAEVEVWSLGENLSLGILDREGSVVWSHSSSSGPIGGFDGDVFTRAELVVKTRARWIVADLGAWFWVDAVRLVLDRSLGIFGYTVGVSDGTEVSPGELSWTTVWSEAQEGGVETFLRFGPLKVRFLRILGIAPAKAEHGGIYIHEAQVFGEGYVPEIPLTSQVIEAGAFRKLNAIEWTADTPSGTSIAIQARTGDTLGKEKHYFDASGNEVTEYQWRYKLPGFARGPVKIEPIPGSDWSPWSRPYEQSGAPFQSPSPKKYLQIRVKLLSDDPYQAPSLKSLTIPFTTPLTETISGTLSPREVQRLGAHELFTLKIYPLLQPWHPGFNQLLIQTLDRMEMKLLKMEVKKDSTSMDWTDRVEILPTPPDSLWMVLPDTMQAGDAQEIELQFESALYQDSTPFNVFVGNTSLPGVWQQVESEDFHPFLNTFIVFVPLDKKMIDNVEIIPSVLTPNGDGVNDVMTIHFTVGRIKAPRDVWVTIYDLRGRSVRHLVERRDKYPLGKYAMEWDGRDDEGELVDPGMYVVVIRVHSNWEEARNTEVRRRVEVIY